MSSVEVAGVVGGRIGDWIIEDLLAFGEPQRFACRRSSGDEEPAVVLVAPLGGSGERKLEREYQALRVLDHLGVPRVMDWGRDDDRGLAYLATDYFDGDPLADWLITGPLDWRDACHVMRHIAEALLEVHRHSLVHRDVNPTKVLVGPGWSARLVGFDLCLDAAQSNTNVEVPTGQITYIAPEVIAQDDYGPRADLYALGVVFFEAITGRPAFPAALRSDRPDAAKRMLQWKTRAAPLDPGDVAPGWMARLIQKATHPTPAERLPDIEAFIGWLDAAEAAWRRRPQRVQPVAVAATAPPPPILAVGSSFAPPAHTVPPVPQPSFALPPREQPTVEFTEVVVAGLPVALGYLFAVALGVFSAVAFSALVILMVEVLL